MSVFKLSNHIFDLGLTAKELSVYTYLCSIPSVQNTIDNKSIIKVKQSTIAENCCVKATQTVSAVISKLIDKGVVEITGRSTNAKHHKSTYTYAVKKLPDTTEYFFVDRHIFGKLNTIQMTVYLFLCKAYDSTRRDSWNSYNDISKALCMKRESVIQAVAELTEMKYIVRMKRKSKDNKRVFVDNHYQIIIYVVGHIRKKGTKKVWMHSHCTHTSVQQTAKPKRQVNYIILFLKSQEYTKNFFTVRGSP